VISRFKNLRLPFLGNTERYSYFTWTSYNVLLPSFCQLVKRQSRQTQGCAYRVKSYLNTHLIMLNDMLKFYCANRVFHTLIGIHHSLPSLLAEFWTPCSRSCEGEEELFPSQDQVGFKYGVPFHSLCTMSSQP
jgi:hypothetical protein